MITIWWFLSQRNLMIRLYVSKGKYHDITYSIETFTKILRNLEFEVFFKNRKRKYMLFAIKLAPQWKLLRRNFPVSIVSWRKRPFPCIPLSVKVLALNFKAYYGLKMLWKTQSGRKKRSEKKRSTKIAAQVFKAWIVLYIRKRALFITVRVL